MMKLVLAGAMASMALCGAAAAESASRPSEPCLRSNLIDGFQKATRDSVVLTQGSRQWLVETAGTCSGLDFANTIGTKSRTTCFTAGDSLVFSDAGFRQSCMVSDVTYLPKDTPKAQTN